MTEAPRKKFIESTGSYRKVPQIDDSQLQKLRVDPKQGWWENLKEVYTSTLEIMDQPKYKHWSLPLGQGFSNFNLQLMIMVKKAGSRFAAQEWNLRFYISNQAPHDIAGPWSTIWGVMVEDQLEQLSKAIWGGKTLAQVKSHTPAIWHSRDTWNYPWEKQMPHK